MDQPEEILEKLQRFNVQKNPEITRELDEYVSFVARTGESVYNWALVKKLYREKLINVITEFYNETPTKELPQYPNVDPFNYETMKKMLIEKLDSFNAAPFTIQRISELLSDPRKQYSRIDKFMRAVEKNILVVSTISPSRNRSEESENGDSLDSVGLNGDFSSDVNVDVDMENDGSFTMTKEFNATTIRKEPTHEVTETTHETITIKKVASKEEEATTSTVAVNVANGEPLSGTQTDIKIESQSTVTVNECEEENKSEENIEKTSEKTVEESEKADETVIKSDIQQQHEPITVLTENVEPKIDDVLLNEPLQPVHDEILPENPETTPLAALENIVANRVEVVVTDTPRVEEQMPQKQEEEMIEETKTDDNVTTENEQKEEHKPEEEPAEKNLETDDSGIEAKRIKIEEVEVPTNKEVAADIPTEMPIEQPEILEENIQAEVLEEPCKEDQHINLEPETQEQQQVEEEQKEEIQEITESVVENIETMPIVEEPQIEAISEVKEMEDIPVETEPIVESVNRPESIPQIEPIPEQPSVPEPTLINNTMTLDEEPPVQLTEISQEMPEMESAALNNKMDTDDNETENVLMDTMETDDAEEPMDQ